MTETIVEWKPRPRNTVFIKLSGGRFFTIPVAQGEAFKPGGGYVFNNVHNIQAGVPPENILAMYEAAYEFGVY